MANGIPAGLTIESIRAQMDRLDEAETALRRAKTAGIELVEQEKQIKENRSRLLKLKQAYFPGQ